MKQHSEEISRIADHLALESAGRAFIGVWCRSQERVAAHVPPTQLRTLEVIAAKPDIGIRGLADELGVIASSASRLCDRLVASGLLRREPSDTDRRQVALHTTPDGDQLLRDISRQRVSDLREVLDRMPGNQCSQLLVGLSAFARYVGNGDPP